MNEAGAARAAGAQLSHVIIAGVNKCGTTAIYRYLSDHPDTCGSSVKETRFFHEYVTDRTKMTYDHYRSFFGDCDSGVAVEASPTYFTSGRKLARRVDAVLPRVKLVVLLRNPCDRLRSYFRSAKSYDNYATSMLTGYSFDDFVREAIDCASSDRELDDKESEFRRALEQGNYAAHAGDFHTVFPSSRVRYVFFEEFGADPAGCVRELCDFIGIDPGFYSDYEFTVENKSRSYKSQGLQKAVFRANMRLEALLNRFPAVRRWLRSAYLRLNEDRNSAQEPPAAGTLELLDEYYAEPNARLRAFMSEHYPDLKRPAWLDQSG